MTKKDEEIQRKLEELESAVLKETPTPSQQHLTAPQKSSDLMSLVEKKQLPATPVQNDLMYFSGIGLILTGLFMFFQHVRVGTGMMGMLGLGSGGFGLLFLPLLVGIGWLIYDPKSKVPWIMITGTCAIIIFSVLSSIVMQFPAMSLIGLILMLLPFAAGGALLLKGMGGPKAIGQKFNKKSE
jgi:hypothetical protein